MATYLTLGLSDRAVTLAAGVEPYEQTTATSSDAFHVNTVEIYLTLGLTDRGVTLAHLPPAQRPGVARDRDCGSTLVSIATQLAQAGE